MEIFTECRRVIKLDGIMTVMFTHKSTAAWDALTVALIDAGFSITRTWPIKTEAESSIHIKDRAAARTTILLVCRPRQDNQTPEPWHKVEEFIAEEVKNDIENNLSKANLKPIDLYLSAFGPASRSSVNTGALNGKPRRKTDGQIHFQLPPQTPSRSHEQR